MLSSPLLFHERQWRWSINVISHTAVMGLTGLVVLWQLLVQRACVLLNVVTWRGMPWAAVGGRHAARPRRLRCSMLTQRGPLLATLRRISALKMHCDVGKNLGQLNSSGEYCACVESALQNCACGSVRQRSRRCSCWEQWCLRGQQTGCRAWEKRCHASRQLSARWRCGWRRLGQSGFDNQRKYGARWQRAVLCLVGCMLSLHILANIMSGCTCGRSLRQCSMPSSIVSWKVTRGRIMSSSPTEACLRPAGAGLRQWCMCWLQGHPGRGTLVEQSWCGQLDQAGLLAGWLDTVNTCKTRCEEIYRRATGCGTGIGRVSRSEPWQCLQFCGVATSRWHTWKRCAFACCSHPLSRRLTRVTEPRSGKEAVAASAAQAHVGS